LPRPPTDNGRGEWSALAPVAARVAGGDGMNRTVVLMMLCVAAGAAVMYPASNYRQHAEPPQPQAVPQTPGAAQIPAEPRRLPDALTRTNEKLGPNPSGGVILAGGLQPDADPASKVVPVTQITETVSVPGGSKSVRWRPRAETEPPIRLFTTNPTITLGLVLNKDDTWSVTIAPGAGGNPITATKEGKQDWVTATTPDNQAATFTIDFTKVPPAGMFGPVEIRIKAKGKEGKGEFRAPPLRLNVPLAGAAARVIIDQYANSPFFPPVNRPADGTKVSLFGTFFQLGGRELVQQPGTLAFVLQLDQSGETAIDLVAEPQVAPPGFWSARMKNLPGFAEGTEGFIAVRVEHGNSHVYAAERVLFTARASLPSLKAPTLVLAKPATPNPIPLTKLRDATGRDTGLFASNTRTLTATINVPAGAQGVVLYVDGKAMPKEIALSGADTPNVTIPVELIPALKNTLRAIAVRGDLESEPALAEVVVRTEGPVVESVAVPGFGSSGGVGHEKIAIRFAASNPLDPATARVREHFVLTHNERADNRNLVVGLPDFDPATNTVTLQVGPIVPGSYKLAIVKEKIRDVFNNVMAPVAGVTDPNVFETTLFTVQIDRALPSVSAGVTLQTGPSVTFPEYVKFRVSPDGFNPSDRVETRVVRLYYYRDAHRVSQIVNRTVKSYNAATVDVRRRAADRVRDDANMAEDERKRLELVAVRASQDARAAEAELNALQNKIAMGRAENNAARVTLAQQQQTLREAMADPTRAREVAVLQANIANIERTLVSLDAMERQAAGDVAQAQAKVAATRDAEARALEAWQVKELQERRLRETQFRREVAAAREDPDTYAPGDPNSVDPVLQVSVSVIGEGLIQLRGPIKGLNVIRTMINQIDAPVGQVKIAVHTLQVNGERADRMEKVVANIQRYIDHSRFLTANSALMLRKSVTLVASRKAVEAAVTLAPGCTQFDRDLKYLYAFFGRDFIDELLQIDSEFLKTGNKLLSLHSMDSTSLSAALFLMALAKNDVRNEILAVFFEMLQRDLPQAEWNFYLAGVTGECKKCEACCDKKWYALSQNARFQSLLGYFDGLVEGNETLNPLQREFIRLAQIFKARMITEMQLKQRVMERSLLEERFGPSYKEQREAALRLEAEANAELAVVQKTLQSSSVQATLAIREILAALAAWEETAGEILQFLDELDRLWKPGDPDFTATDPAPRTVKLGGRAVVVTLQDAVTQNINVPPEVMTRLTQLEGHFDQFVYLSEENRVAYDEFKSLMSALRRIPVLTRDERKQMQASTAALARLLQREIAGAKAHLKAITDQLTGPQPDPAQAQSLYAAFRDDVLSKLRQGQPYRATALALFKRTDEVFGSLTGAVVNYQVALKRAQDSRRPLDEKKLLDLLVDEMEDKFIEILEGTRAHTANIDNYMKGVATALEDDFNTQFYFPSFRRAREVSRSWDITLSQIETTNVLTNNRGLGKVSPAATFEFDLPKRDILITEGFRSAKALIDEYGALVNDPSFLGLAKLYSGNPVSMMTGTGGSMAAVRNVLPGLPTSSDEKIMAQAGPGRKEFGAALEALIPDPAVYKFETGTGFEVRPVLSPDGQAVVFTFDYMYTTDVREPVRADEKHLGRVKRHFVHTDVQLSNFELREVSKYQVAIKVARTGKGVQLLQDVPGLGVLFRPLPSAGASLQQNLIYAQGTIFPTLFDLMGLRYAPAVADLDPLADRMAEFAARYRRMDVEQRIFDIGASRVDDALRTPFGERRADLYRPQMNLPYVHPNGYQGPGLRLRDGHLIEGHPIPYDPRNAYPATTHSPGITIQGRPKPLEPREVGPGPYPVPNCPPPPVPGAPGSVTLPRGYPGPGPIPPGYPMNGAHGPGYTYPTGPAVPVSPEMLGQPRPVPALPQPLPYPPTPLPGHPPTHLPPYPLPAVPGTVYPPSSAGTIRELPTTQQPPVVTPGAPPGPRLTMPTAPAKPYPVAPQQPTTPAWPPPQPLAPAAPPAPAAQPSRPGVPTTLPTLPSTPPSIPTLPAGLSIATPANVPVPTLGQIPGLGR
jgi:hypothetical protein